MTEGASGVQAREVAGWPANAPIDSQRAVTGDLEKLSLHYQACSCVSNFPGMLTKRTDGSVFAAPVLGQRPGKNMLFLS